MGAEASRPPTATLVGEGRGSASEGIPEAEVAQRYARFAALLSGADESTLPPPVPLANKADEALRRHFEARLVDVTQRTDVRYIDWSTPDTSHVPCLVMLLRMLFADTSLWWVNEYVPKLAAWDYHGGEPWYDAAVLRGCILAVGRKVPEISRARLLARQLATVGVPASREDLEWLRTTPVGRCIVRGIYKDGGIPFNEDVAEVRARMTAGDWFKDVLSDRAIRWGAKAPLLRLTPATSELNAAAMATAGADERELATVVHAMRERPHMHDPVLRGKTDRRTFQEATGKVASFLGGYKAHRRPGPGPGPGTGPEKRARSRSKKQPLQRFGHRRP
jgi:hypothetical protein